LSFEVEDMKTSFVVGDTPYEAHIRRVDKPGGENYEICDASVRSSDEPEVRGRFRLTDTAIAAAEERASREGGSAEEWLVRGCVRSLTSELVIRRLKQDFSFVIDHRWIGY
jgi:hypothetical protein